MLVPLSLAHAGTTPVHTLIQSLEGDFSGLPAQDNPRFGYSVALHGDTLVVGAPGTVNNGAERGAVFIYRRHPDNDSWQFEQRLLFDLGGAGQCGHAVAVNEFSLLVGCPFHSGRGRAVFYNRSTSSAPFESSVSFVDDSVQAGAECGSSVTLIDGAPDTLSPLPMAAVGCPNRRDFPAGSFGLVGGVDIYRNLITQWALATTLGGPGTSASGFGHSLSLSRSEPLPGVRLFLAVGVPGFGSSNGSVRFYWNNSTVGSWSQQPPLIGPTAGSRFGHSVHMRANRLAVGAPERTVPNPLTQPPNLPTATGSVIVLYCEQLIIGGCIWREEGNGELITPLLPLPTTTPQNRAGESVQMLTPDRMIAGAPRYPFGSFIGQARHYELVGGNWLLNGGEPFFPVAPAPATAEFGASMSGDDAWLAIGAPGYPQENTGRVFVYAYDYDDTLFYDGFDDQIISDLSRPHSSGMH